MELEVKKNKEGQQILEIKDQSGTVSSFNLDNLIDRLCEDFSDYSFEYKLARLGLRYAILGYDKALSEERHEETIYDLCLIETIIESLSHSVKRTGIYQQIRNMKLNYEADMLGLKHDNKELIESFNIARNTADEYSMKNLNLTKENEELKEKIQILKRKTEILEKKNGTKN